MSEYQTHIVIGANYGDEGKGKCVRHLITTSYRDGSSVVNARFSGSSNCGHTVEFENGYRRVYHSVGSGTAPPYSTPSLAAAATVVTTHLGKAVGIDPGALIEELLSFDKMPFLSIHPGAPVITPWDIALNQVREISRGSARHGSCGRGLGEMRSRGYATKGLNSVRLKAKANRVEDVNYAFQYSRREYLKLKESTPNLKELLRNTSMGLEVAAVLSGEIPTGVMIRNFLAEVDMLHEMTGNGEPGWRAVWEGNQGLLLDQDNLEHFPYVTHSHTGVAGVIGSLHRAKDIPLTATYVTRPYLTRHGEGPMHAALGGSAGEKTYSEMQELGFNIVDLTNSPNPWQGSLRFGLMDWPKFIKRVKDDHSKLDNVALLKNPLRVAISCQDQCPDHVLDEMYDYLTRAGIEVIDLPRYVQ